MYEFDYVSVANASLKVIQEAHDNVLKILKVGLKKVGLKPKDIKDEKPVNPLLSKKYDEETQLCINMYNYTKSNLNVVVAIDELKQKGLELKHFEKLIKKSNELNLNLNVFITGYSQFGSEKEHVHMLFKNEILTTLIALNNYLISNNISPIKFLENNTLPQNAWTLKEVFDANQEIDSLVETIKLQQFSPFEAIIFIHHYITNKFQYKENSENPEISRSIVGVLNSDNIVCVGYAELTKAIIDKLNMPGLSSETLESVIKSVNKNQTLLEKSHLTGVDDNMNFAHLQNLITIDDPKYNIKGTYVSDTCWDSKNDEFDMGKGFGYCMFPVDDLFHLSNKSFQQLNQLNDTDSLEIMTTDKEIPIKSMPIYKKYYGKYNPIPAETYKNCIYKVLRKIYPFATIAEINHYTNYYMAISEINAFDTFSGNVKHSLAIEAPSNPDICFKGEDDFSLNLPCNEQHEKF